MTLIRQDASEMHDRCKLPRRSARIKLAALTDEFSDPTKRKAKPYLGTWVSGVFFLRGKGTDLNNLHRDVEAEEFFV